MKARKARLSDVQEIHALIAHYAAEGLLLPRTAEEIHEHVARFLVLEEAGKVIGCVALESYGPDLAEIRSLAVDPQTRGKGLGQRLLRFALAIAKRRKIARVFAVTHAPEFFGRQGFVPSTRWAIPEKIARDCRTCPKARRCDLVAVVAMVIPERITFPVLAEAKPAPAA